MKLCYVDETGLDGGDDAVIMVGIVVDVHHLNKSLREWQARLDALLEQLQITELKSSKFYNGSGSIGKKMSGGDRAGWISESLEWLVNRSMKIALSAVDRSATPPAEHYKELTTPWLACGFTLRSNFSADMET